MGAGDPAGFCTEQLDKKLCFAPLPAGWQDLGNHNGRNHWAMDLEDREGSIDSGVFKVAQNPRIPSSSPHPVQSPMVHLRPEQRQHRIGGTNCHGHLATAKTSSCEEKSRDLECMDDGGIQREPERSLFRSARPCAPIGKLSGRWRLAVGVVGAGDSQSGCREPIEQGSASHPIRPWHSTCRRADLHWETVMGSVDEHEPELLVPGRIPYFNRRLA